jgi:predicted RNA methylase
VSARHTLTIPDDVGAVLRESQLLPDRVVLPARQLERKLYAGVIKVLAEFGGKWSRSAGAILIKAGDREKLVAALDSGTVRREKVALQKFYTPSALARRFVEFATDGVDLPTKVDLLEPSAGAGALIDAARSSLGPRLRHVVAVDVDIEALEALDRRLPGIRALHRDFLGVTAIDIGAFPLILQNAPYQRGQARKHFDHALRFLAPGGVIAAIVPRNFAPTADIFLEREDIEAGAFKESGTNIATMMVRYVRGAA